MARYRLGDHVPQNATLRSIKRRALWAARQAGVKAEALRGIRWRFVRSIHIADDSHTEECGGICYRDGGRMHIVCVVDERVQDYVVHELAHAALWPVEADRDADGNPCDDHGPLFRTLLRHMRRIYARTARGPSIVG